MRLTEDRRNINPVGRGPILMLVPHEPEEDPRIRWVIEFCSQLGRTDVLGYTDTVGEKPTRSYDGIVFVDRSYASDYHLGERHSILWRLLRLLLWRLPRFVFIRFPDVIYRLLRNPRVTTAGSPRLLKGARLLVNMSGRGQTFLKDLEIQAEEVRASRKRGFPESWNPQSQSWGLLSSLHHFVVTMQFFYVISKTLYRRARSSSLRPSLIICHDLYALLAGVRLKKLFGCPILYDSHELWPEAFLEAKQWEGKLIALLERRAIRYADAVITVTPQIARYLEHLYTIRGVHTVPNAEPLVNHVTPSCHRPLSIPLKFILQTRVVSGRGTEELMEAWSRLKNTQAVLIIRARDNPYFAYLRERYQKEIDGGTIVIAPPVPESDLVESAASADVGIIPYRGPSLCHVYACPNKLSQYMQAGLAILCTTDLEFVSDIVRRQECGMIYDAAEPTTLIETVESLVDNPDRLQSMKERAYGYARSEFNWQKQSRSYIKLVDELSRRR